MTDTHENRRVARGLNLIFWGLIVAPGMSTMSESLAVLMVRRGLLMPGDAEAGIATLVLAIRSIPVFITALLILAGVWLAARAFVGGGLAAHLRNPLRAVAVMYVAVSAASVVFYTMLVMAWSIPLAAHLTGQAVDMSRVTRWMLVFVGALALGSLLQRIGRPRDGVAAWVVAGLHAAAVLWLYFGFIGSDIMLQTAMGFGRFLLFIAALVLLRRLRRHYLTSADVELSSEQPGSRRGGAQYPELSEMNP